MTIGPDALLLKQAILWWSVRSRFVENIVQATGKWNDANKGAKDAYLCWTVIGVGCGRFRNDYRFGCGLRCDVKPMLNNLVGFLSNW